MLRTTSPFTRPFLSTSHLASNVHVTVGAGLWDLVFAGVVGGMTILAGVVTAEWLVRVRERRRVLDHAMEDLYETALFSRTEYPDEDAVRGAINRFALALDRLAYYARWPIPGAESIRAEAIKAHARHVVSYAKWRSGDAPPDLLYSFGERLRRLVMGAAEGGRETDTALEEAGFPPVREWETYTGWAKGPLRTK